MEPATSGHHCSPLLDDRQFPIDVRFIIAISTVWAFSQIPASVAMDALQYSSEAWNAVTVVMHLLGKCFSLLESLLSSDLCYQP